MDKSELHKTSRDTLMGRLLRSFWQPIARSDSVAPGAARGLKVMGEELTLYRGESGAAHLVGGRCAHRCTVLHTGWIQGEDIRCMYHGWKYDGSGRCIEIPAEKKPRSVPIRIAGYPLHEYCGLVFAYMGEGAAPEFDLPRKHVLEEPGRVLVIQEQVWDCNWLQQIENSLDAVHVSFVHIWGKSTRFDQGITTAVPELEYSETAAGIRQVATRSKDNVRVSDWTFPNNNHVVAPGARKGDPWSDISVWAVPIDDERTMRYTIHSFYPAAAAAARELAEGADRNYDPSNHYEELFHQHRASDVSDMQFISAQDYVAVRGQGVIFERERENLSSSDAGIMLIRKIFWREMQAIHLGQPTKKWRRLEEKFDLPVPAAESAY
jgi:5,5'-dehydrodivanillate O-demethylase oxygenase subunit